MTGGQPADFQAPIPLQAVIDGTAARFVDPTILRALNIESRKAEKSTAIRSAALALSVPFGIIFLVLAFVLGPKILLKLGAASLALKLKSASSMASKLMWGLVKSKGSIKALIGGLSSAAIAFRKAPLSTHRWKIRRRLLAPLVDRLDGVKKLGRRDVETATGRDLVQILRAVQLIDEAEILVAHEKAGVTVLRGETTVHAVPFKFDRYDSRTQRNRTTFVGTAIVAALPADAPNPELSADWSYRPSADPSSPGNGDQSWRAGLGDAMILCGAFNPAPSGRFKSRDRLGLAVHDGIFVALVNPIQLMNQSEQSDRIPMLTVAERFFADVKRVVAVADALNAAAGREDSSHAREANAT